MKATKWIEAILGLWVLLSPWMLASTAISMSNAIVGILIILLVGMDLFGGKNSASSPQM